MQSKNWPDDFSILKLCGLVLLSLGAVVMYGWLSGNAAIVQVHSRFVPMQFNTALGFAVTGLMLLSLGFRKYILSGFFALLVFCGAAATVLEYILDADFGIDEFFVESYIMTKTTHPGRMAPATGLCFMAAALSCFVSRRFVFVSLGLSATIGVISLLALFSYIAGFDDIYGFGVLTRMAAHTVFGFFIVSAGLLFYAKHICLDMRHDPWGSLPVVVGIVGTVLTLFSVYSISELGKRQNYQYFEDLISDSENGLYSRFVVYRQALIGTLGFLQASEYVDRREWRAYVGALDVERYLQGIGGIAYAEYVHEDNLEDYLETVRKDGAPGFINHPQTPYEDKYIVKYIEPMEGNRQALGLDLGFEETRRAAIMRARDTGRPTLTGKIDLVQDYQKRAGFLLLVPHYSHKGRGHLEGLVAAPFLTEYFLQGISRFSKRQIDLRIYEGIKESPENLIYTGRQFRPDASSVFFKRSVFNVAGQKWNIQWQTTDRFAPPYDDAEVLYAFILGAFITFFVTFVLRQLVLRRQMVDLEVQKRTEELDDMRHRLRLVMDHIPDPIFLYDRDFYIIDTNPAFLALLEEKTAEDVTGNPFQDFFPTGIAEKLAEEGLKAFSRGSSSFELAFDDESGNGNCRKVLMFKNVAFSDKEGHEYILSVARDVSDLYHAQDMLRESEERFNLAIKAANIGLWDWDQETGKFYFNEEWYTILGYEPYELPVRFRTWRDLVHPDDLEEALDQLNRHLDGETEELNSILRMKRKSGEWAWVGIQGQVLRWDDKGRPARVVGIQVDMTDLKSKEIEAEKARAQARHASAMKSEFVANISHELRTPLSGIIGVTELLEKTELSRKQAGYVDIIHSSGNRLLNLINDVLDFSKIEAGMIRLKPAPVRLKDVVEETVKLHALQAMNKHIQLGVGYDPDIPETLVADAVRLQQVLTNLLGNAIKFTDRGRVVLGVHLKEEKKKKVKIRFKVIDQGIGIPEEHLEQIFEKFGQVDSSPAKRHEGTGLGLAITKDLVDMMGGEVHVESLRGEGSVFWFDLDLDKDVAPGTKRKKAKAETSGPEQKSKKTKTASCKADILLVEDEEVNSLVAQEILEQAGCRVDVAASGPEALACIKQRLETRNGRPRKKPAPYDLVLMDCMMPGMDGYETTRALRAYEQSRDYAPRHFVVAMTAKSLDGDPEKYLKEGMDDFFAKPVRRKDLGEMLDVWLSARRKTGRKKNGKD